MFGKLFNGAIAALCALIMIGAGLSAYFISHPDRREIVHLKLEEGSEETLSFEDLALLPGEETSYIVSLSGDVEGEGEVTVDFKSDEEALAEDNRLADHLYARVTVGNEVICDALLSTLLDGDAFVFTNDFSATEYVDLKVSYYILSNAGNEVQGARASFYLAVRVDNIKE